VEQDPSQVNLTALELFQTERRPFFIEGVDAFRFDTSLAFTTRGDSFLEETPFYSRRIGHAPGGAPPPDADAAGFAMPSTTRLLGAAKLSGHTASGWTTGIFSAVSGREEGAFTPRQSPASADLAVASANLAVASANLAAANANLAATNTNLAATNTNLAAANASLDAANANAAAASANLAAANANPAAASAAGTGVPGTGESGRARERWPVEPLTATTVARVARDFGAGESTIGGFVSSTHRTGLDDVLRRQFVGDALTFGVEGRHRFADRTYELRG